MSEVIEYPAEVEMGESVEVVLGNGRIEAFLSDNVYILDPHSHHSRVALRAYAFSLASEGMTREAKDILRSIGREG